jgi:hypothetical protein
LNALLAVTADFSEPENLFMRRNNYRSSFGLLRNSFSPAAFLLLLLCGSSFAQNPEAPYTVISSNEHEVIISVHPHYQIRTVTDEKTGESYEHITFAGNSVKGIPAGAPETGSLPINLLAPSKEPLRLEILKEEYEPAHNGVLAPVPTYSFAHDQFKTPQERFSKNEELYSNTKSFPNAELGSKNIFRTAYTQELRIHPIRFDVNAKTISLVKELTIKIIFPKSTTGNLVTLKPLEAEFFQKLFVNGNVSEFYHSALSEVTKAVLPNAMSYKQQATLGVGEKWAVISTNGQGVYRITASDMANAGISNTDATSLQLFGYGGATVPEDLDSATGELHECAIDVIKNGDGSVSEVRFYEPGMNEWYYHKESFNTPLFGLYHLLNPFTTSGHYLLKAGGSASSKRISMQPENVVSPILKNSVPTVVIHESEERFEQPNISRELLGEDIPKGRDQSISLPDLPGYTSDSTIIRPAFNAHAETPHTINIAVNGTSLSPILSSYTVSFDGEDYTARNWKSEMLAGNILRSGNNSMVISATTSEADAKFWLDWVEIFYRRQASLSNGQVPFYLLADGRSFNFNFTEASSGETWNVTDPSNPIKVAAASGSTMNVQVQGDSDGFKQYIAFNTGSIKSASVSSSGPLALHEGVCQNGAEDIIVTPKEYLDQANKLAKQRTMGGQATPPMSVAVVTTEDIYREFGYGSPDYTAIRNFLAYTFRHTTANNTTKPLFLTLFSNGHCDYRNKTTQIPVGVPIYETWHSGSASNLSPSVLRANQPRYDPDDAFFVHLTPGSDKLDVAVGRIVVHNADEADAFVSKVIKYETSSDEGDWRARTTYICDDRYYENLKGQDPIPHIDDTKQEMAEMPQRILANDVFGVAYTNTFTSAGRRKPEMEKAIVDAFNSGSAIISWVGHGNPVIWANEAILTVPATINKLTNFNRLAFVTTATCDFSRYDNYAAPVSGGVQLITKADGGAIAALGTCRSVFGEEPLVPEFYRVLLNVGCGDLTGTTPIGVAYIAGRSAGRSGNAEFFYIMGDPSQRIIIPRQYVTIDSINGAAFNEQSSPNTIPALSEVSISGHISNYCDGSDLDANFNGNAALTLFDAPTHVSVTTTFLEQGPITDTWDIDGPVLYHGSSTVKNGKFRSTFIVPKDIKFDTNRAKISVLAYSDNFHSALGAARNVVIYGIDNARANSDHEGPKLTPYIGSRAFKSGDVVPVNSKIIVDVVDISGLNSSTASIGHSFIGWTDDSTSGAIDLASTYVSEQDNYSRGTSEQQAQLPVGKHILRVRAFDALNNPTFAEVEFTAKAEEPYSLYNTQIFPNPVNNKGTFTFLQPSSPESPVDITVSIYTIIGQKVRELSAQGISQNAVSIPFDAKDDYGTILADGAYVYRITARERLSGTETSAGGTFLIVRQ